MDLRLLVPFCNILALVLCTYQPLGDEVQAGSVLLPATRRGRYLANIIKRQAVDGTGIKFNKNADRMNAEAKKKVDVLSDDLLPYIIGEQERRTTLHMRVMTAIQNGEKGVTVAEIRNKPPLFIRKGLMYRCPSNMAILEPDGSGVMMCEKDVRPSLITYDSCLSAEDRDLYAAGSKYFFCNRHRVEGPDLPKNGTAVIGCAPAERTSLNYTYSKCALEDSEDVVVHYRYYPDKTYKYVNELDPENEVCDHWRPCQVGYIFSLPTPDQAQTVHELWKYVEAVPDMDGQHFVAEDFLEEFIHRDGTPDGKPYVPSPRRVALPNVPEGYLYQILGYRKSTHTYIKIGAKKVYQPPYVYVQGEISIPNNDDQSHFMSRYHIGSYSDETKLHEISNAFLYIERTAVKLKEVDLHLAVGQKGGVHSISFYGPGHRVKNVRVRGANWQVYNLHPRVCKIRHDNSGGGTIEINVSVVTKNSFGHYFAIISDPEGREQKLRVMQVIRAELGATVERKSFAVGAAAHFQVSYSCTECDVTDVLCDGESALPRGQVTLDPPGTVTFDFSSFEDTDCGVYKAIFKDGAQTYERVLAVLDNVTIPNVPKVAPPAEGAPLETKVPYECAKSCDVTEVSVGGVPLLSSANEGDDPSVPNTGTFDVSPTEITIRISKFSDDYKGHYQGTFRLEDGTSVTKNIMEVGHESEEARRLAAGRGKTNDTATDVTTDLVTEESTTERDSENSTESAPTTTTTIVTEETSSDSSSLSTVADDASTVPATSEDTTKSS